MKNMKFLFVAFFLAAAFIFTSCEEEVDPCDAVVCQNDGVCMDGTCDCPEGTSGTLCGTVWRDVLLGTHSASENCDQGSNWTYNITMTASSTDIRKFIIGNIYNEGHDVIATMTDANNFTIEDTTHSGSEFTNGSGTINGNTATITITVVGSAFTTTCDLTVTL